MQEGLAYAAQEDLWIAAICAAPSVLGENGPAARPEIYLLSGFENDEKYHGTYTAAPLQQDGKIITANGAGNAMTLRCTCWRPCGRGKSAGSGPFYPDEL